MLSSTTVLTHLPSKEVLSSPGLASRWDQTPVFPFPHQLGRMLE